MMYNKLIKKRKDFKNRDIPNRAELELIGILKAMVKEYDTWLIKKKITYYSLLKFCKKNGLRLKYREVFKRFMAGKRSLFVRNYNNKIEKQKRIEK
ncbi:hypothetical protein Megpolyxen_01894 (plasmid) [Candidatus Megaera polyxenophila]|nr:hypothetical protein Megpolyxen_01894 [Candidatus Megaera polyxenophila]